MAEWFFEHAGQPVGPVTDMDLRQRLAHGAIASDTLVWREGMPQWLPVAQVVQSEHATTTGAPAMAAHNGGDPRGLPRTAFAGFWIRVGASLLDAIALLVLNTVLGLVLLGLLNPRGRADLEELRYLQAVVSIVTQVLLIPAFDSSSWQGTPAKRALGLRVVGPLGERLGFGRALGRYLAKLFSVVTLGVGFAMVGWTRYRQGLHDLVTDTYVVRSR